MESGLERLNAMPGPEAETALLSCCGSIAWAKGVAAKRPFESLQGLRETADAIWRELGSEAWREAFRSHRRIGEKRAEKPTTAEADRWSAEEQGSPDDVPPETGAALAEGNAAYEKRFGYIFIVCAQGKNKEEILALLRSRLHNEPGTEIRIAAEEQRRITNLRLEKMTGQR